MDCTLPGYSVHGILQTRILEWVAVADFGEVKTEIWASLVAQMLKNLPAMWETQV